jgi:hypothetical protein
VGAVVVHVKEREVAKHAGKTNRRYVVRRDLKLGIGVSRYVSIDKQDGSGYG